MRKRVMGLVVLTGCGMIATAVAGDCDGVGVLANAAQAYRQLQALSDTARYVVQVPGAPQHREITEFGFDGRRSAYLRMPGDYVMTVQGKSFLLAVDPIDTAARVLRRPFGPDLQSTLDAAFAGHGAPLAPAPLLLRFARSADDEAQAFSSRLLQHLQISACRRVPNSQQPPVFEVILDAGNGSVRAQFDTASALLLRYHAVISTSAGGEPIVADVSFEPQRGIRPADSLARHARTLARVTDFSELTHTRTEEPLNPLQDAGLRNPDGQPFALDRFAGEVTILEFWARWCAPCRLTLPVAARVAAWAQAKNLPVHVVLVNTAEEFASVDAARPEIKRFLRWADISMATALDLDGSFHRRFGGGLPLTIVISPNGQVAARHGGFDAALEESLRREVTDLVRARDAGPSAVPPMTHTGPAGGRGR